MKSVAGNKPIMTCEEKRLANNLASIKRNKKPDRIAYLKAYNASMTPEQRASKRAYKSEYDAANKERYAEYRTATAATRKVQRAAYYRANRDKIMAQVKAYTDANYEKVLAYHAGHYASNKEKVKAWAIAWRKNNRDRIRHIGNARRVRKLNNGGSHTFEELTAKFEALGNACFYCGKGGPISIDHDVPISRGGSDDISNILPACKSCNSSKNAKTAKEFIEWRAKLKALQA